jgi:hypothetical protein
MAAQPQVMYLTKCRFCGMQPPPMPPFVPILNGGIDPKMIAYIGELQKHIEKKHPEQFVAMRQTILQITGWTAVSAFEVQDPLIRTLQEAVRAALHKFTRRLFITDAEIQDRAARLGLDAEQQEGLVMLLRDMRDLLTEEGAYAPQQATPKTLVAP